MCSLYCVLSINILSIRSLNMMRWSNWAATCKIAPLSAKSDFCGSYELVLPKEFEILCKLYPTEDSVQITLDASASIISCVA